MAVGTVRLVAAAARARRHFEKFPRLASLSLDCLCLALIYIASVLFICNFEEIFFIYFICQFSHSPFVSYI